MSVLGKILFDKLVERPLTGSFREDISLQLSAVGTKLQQAANSGKLPPAPWATLPLALYFGVPEHDILTQEEWILFNTFAVKIYNSFVQEFNKGDSLFVSRLACTAAVKGYYR